MDDPISQQAAGPEGSHSDEVPQIPPTGAYPDLGGAFTPLYQRLQEFGVASRITEIGKIGPRGRSADFAVEDPGQFLQAIRSTGRTCTDTPVGRILHPGKISLRENRTSHCLHIAMGQDGRVLAHLDRLSPLAASKEGETCRYSAPRVLAHNATRLWGDLFRSLFGHRLDCAPLLLSLRQAQAEGQQLCDPSPNASPSYPANDPGTQPPPPTPRPATLAAPAADRVCIPFNVIDEAVHVLDSPTEPWSVHLEIRVAGRLDEQRLRSAVPQALAAHPLARARKMPARASAHGYHWEIPAQPDLDPLRVVDRAADGPIQVLRSELESLAVPLTESPPLRICLVHDPAGDVVMLNVNHAASDATGALRLLRSIARAYAGTTDPVPDLDPLEVQDVGALLLAHGMPARARRFRLLAEKARDLANVPARVAPDGAVTAAGYGFHLARASQELTRALLQDRDAAGINSVLIAALHLAIALWNIEHGQHCGRISVLVPVNLRPAAWRQEVVGNFTLLTRVLTTPAQRSLGHVVAAVSDQMERMQREGTLAALIEILARTSPLPLWAKRAAPALLAVTGNRLVDSAQLAYLGEVDDLPEFGPDAGPTRELWFSPPARMPLGLSVGALVAAGQLHLAFRYRPALLDDAAARRFADYYLSLLGHLLRPFGPP